jgi:hypothetical protein
MELGGGLTLKARVQLENIDKPQAAEDDSKRLTIHQGNHWAESPPEYENYPCGRILNGSTAPCTSHLHSLR